MQRLAELNNQFKDQETAKFGNYELKHIPMAPADPILSLSIGFNNDKNPNKVNLGVGAYRTDEGKPYVFPVVKAAEAKIISQNLQKEYLPIDGIQEFNKGSRGAIFGWDHPDVTSGRVASVQSLSGTGALRILADFLIQHRPAPIYVSNPTWGNHNTLFANSGFEVRQYRYYNKKTNGLDLEGMLADLDAATPGSIVLLHVCAHNPTGVDPTLDQWKQIAEVCKDRRLYPFFDCAYQGFVSGDLDKDGTGLRYFLDQGFEMVISQSFAKIMGLYGERTGALHVVCGDKDTAEKVLSQLKVVVRVNYSSPPAHGARIASLILNEEPLRKQWLGELVAVTDRITRMRKLLRENLEKIGAPGTWNHVTDQIGMFSFTGLTPAQSQAMVKEHSIYMTNNGRISVCGLTQANVGYVAQCIKDVLAKHK